MKKLLLVLVGLLLIAGMVLVGASCASTSSSKIGNSFLYYGTLEGKIMDALTGEAIGGDDLEVYFIKNANQVKANKLIRDTEDSLVGHYAFTSVPVGIDNGLLDFELRVEKDDYQEFSSKICITANLIAGQSYYNDQIDNTFTNDMFHMLGNIYLYPLDSSAGDVTVKVLSPQGMPIENASVLLRQNVTSNYTYSYTGNRLYPVAGLYPSLAAETDSDGTATFSGDVLVLGGSYSVVVEAMTFEGQELRTYTSGAFISGTDTATQIVNMNVAVGSQSLVATSASNQIPGTVTSDGIFSITFNQPIIVDLTAFTATVTDGVLASATVNAALSNDDKTLTLTPTFTTLPTAKGATITYTYNGGTILLKYSQSSSGRTLNGGWSDVININTGDAVSRTVLMVSN